MRQQIRLHIKVVVGIFLIAFGVIGLFIPFVPGVPLMLAGMALAGLQRSRIRHLMFTFHQWRRKLIGIVQGENGKAARAVSSRSISK